MVVATIVVCEVAFWILLGAGLTARYAWRRPRLGAVLLLSAPAVDLVLLTVTAVDLARGGEASLAHGLSAAYLGFSVGWGRAVMNWADDRVARWRDGRPAPAPTTGAEYTAACWRDAGRTAVALVVTAAIIGALVAVGGRDVVDTTAPVLRFVAAVAVVETLWAASYSVWPRRASA